MGGRGATSSMGMLGGSGNTQPQTQQPQQPQVDNTQVASAFSTDYNNFMAMSDDEKADAILKAIGMGVPDHLAQNDFQRLIYNTNMNDKPDVVQDSVLDSMGGVEMFRTVNSTYNKPKDIGFTATQIAKQMQGGRITYTDGSVSALGKGLYFAGNTNGYTSRDAYQHSQRIYGKHTGDVNLTATVRAKLNNNAKIMDYSTASQKVLQEMASGSKLGKALRKCDIDSRESIYALSKGYNVLRSTNYYNVLNRNAMTMSSSIKQSQGGRGQW